MRSCGYSATAGSVSRTMPPGGLCAARRSDASHGCSAAPIAGGQRAAVAYSPIQTCRLNVVDPQAWLADVLARIADHPVSPLDELLPWHWKPRSLKAEPDSRGMHPCNLARTPT